MRNWLNWVVGFALAFSCVSLSLLVYSFEQPSLWLPILFGAAFFGLLAFSPRLDLETRVGLATVFGSVSCILWIVSGADAGPSRHPEMQLAFENLLGVMALIGLVISISAISKLPAKARPAMTPIVILILTGWLISYFSSAHGGSTPMVDWVMQTFGWNRDESETAILVVRKSIHFTFYGSIAITAFATPLKNGGAKHIGVIAALLTTLAYATFDEVRQSTQPDRTGSAWDVLLDMTGGSVALVIVSAVMHKKSARGPNAARKSSTL